MTKIVFNSQPHAGYFVLRHSSILKENVRGDCMEFLAQTTTIQEQNHTISILFSTYTDFVSRIIGLFSKFGCTHVSVALDDDEEHFYAFNTKGFRKEYPKNIKIEQIRIHVFG